MGLVGDRMDGSLPEEKMQSILLEKEMEKSMLSNTHEKKREDLDDGTEDFLANKILVERR